MVFLFVCLFLNLEFVLQLRNELFVKPIGKKKKHNCLGLEGRKKKSMPTDDPCSRSSLIKKIDFSSGNKKVKYVEGIDWG